MSARREEAYYTSKIAKNVLSELRTRLRLNGAIFRIMSLQRRFLNVYEKTFYTELALYLYVLQYAAFRLMKGHVLHGKRPPFAA